MFKINIIKAVTGSINNKKLNGPEFYSCYATKADCILNQVGNQLLYYGL